MAIASFQLDPAAGGVSQSEFDTHTHAYQKLSQLGVDASKTFSTPVRTDTINDSEVWLADATDLEVVAVTLAGTSTGVPE